MLGLAGYRFSNWGSLAVLLAMRPRLVRPENVGNVGIGFCLTSVDVSDRLLVCVYDLEAALSHSKQLLYGVAALVE